MEINKELLINALRGTNGPHYSLFSKYENLGLGKYFGGFQDRWCWDLRDKVYESFTEEQLKEFYMEVKNS